MWIGVVVVWNLGIAQVSAGSEHTFVLTNDGDAYGDFCDEDDDNDGVLDKIDDFPFDPTESVDPM